MCLYPVSLKRGVVVNCGKCVECLIRKSNEWAFRIMDEASHYEKNCFVTLTYNEEYLPQGGNLCRRHLTLFIKRLRKFLYPCKIRYFACGEYGKKGNRPHYHIIIFGYDFDDKTFFCYDNKKTSLFRSLSLERLWTFGYSSIGVLNLDSAKYCAKYMQKLNKKTDLVKPFVAMSTNPGIGYNSIHIDMLNSDKIYRNGKYIPVPRYYIKVLEKNLVDTSYLKEKRRNLLKENYRRSTYEDLKKRRKKFFVKFGKTR